MNLKIKNSNLVAIIDDEDYLKVKDYVWRLTRKKYNDGSNYLYVSSHINIAKYKTKTVYLHRIITDCPAGLVVDHIDGNTLDNRKSNLKICTQSENCKNRRKRAKT